MLMDLSLRKHFWKQKMKANEELQLKFLKRLSRLLGNGYPILTALEKLKWDNQLTTLAKQIIISLKNGDAIHSAFEQANFHESITSFLYFVHANNDLDGSLKKAINMFEQRLKNRKKFKQIIRYPILLVFIFSILLYFVKEFVLPGFLDIFTEESNLTVKYTIIIIDTLTNITVITIILFVVISISWLLIQQNVSIQKQIQLYKKIPIYRNYVMMQTSYFFATHFGSLLKTGMSYREMLKHMENQQKLPIIAHYAKLITNDLSRGVHFSYSVSQLDLLDKRLISIFNQDGDVDALESDLSIYAEMLMEDIEEKTLRLMTWLQPLILILIGGFIIFLYISLMWPMFQLIKTV